MTTALVPVIISVVGVYPSIQAESPQVVGLATSPTIVGAEPLAPRIVDTNGPQQQTGADKPSIVGAENLVPRIAKAEEE